jgi:PAS domain S-box-containing protein
MATSRLRILHLEDSATDGELVFMALKSHGIACDILRVDTRPAFLAALEQGPFDLILGDYRLPSFDGLTALALTRERDAELPFIFVSATLGEEALVEALKAGATDYVLKERLSRLGPAVLRALEERSLRQERRLAEEALREIDVRFHQVVDHIKDVFYLLEPEIPRMVHVNPAYESVWGRTRASLLSRPESWVEAIHPDDRPRVEARRRQTLRDRIDFDEGYRVVQPSGSVRWIRDRGFWFQDPEGRWRMGGFAEDMTEQKETEEALHRQRGALLQAEKLAAMGTLLAGVAHELNNPLSVVLGQSALLRRAVGEGPLLHRVDRIAEAAERCARIVGNFLALARQRPPERQKIVINQIVGEALELFAYPLRVDEVEVVTQLGADLPIVWADPHQLQQLLINLIANAHHAMRSAPAPRRLTLKTSCDEAREHVLLEVGDTGPGMAPEVAGRVFDPFFTTKPPGQGTGLGLSLCRGIVESHGGRIDAGDAPGGGALFSAELPVGSSPAARAPDEKLDASPVRQRKLLVVDDESAVAEVLAEMLREDGHVVDIAGSGTAALRKLEEGSYDLVFSDIKMPELDGPGLYEQVEKRHPQLVGRFVFLTGDSLSAETSGFLQSTGSPSLEKPFRMDQVQQVLREVLARNP